MKQDFWIENMSYYWKHFSIQLEIVQCYLIITIWVFCWGIYKIYDKNIFEKKSAWFFNLCLKGRNLCDMQKLHKRSIISVSLIPVFGRCHSILQMIWTSGLGISPCSTAFSIGERIHS